MQETFLKKFCKTMCSHHYLVTLLITIFFSCYGNGCFKDKVGSENKTVLVKKGEFVISLSERGEIKAIKERTLVTPHVNFSLKIVELVEEGTKVKKGDVLLKFDDSEIRKRISDSGAELEIRQASLSKALADHESRVETLKSNLESANASYQLAQLNLEKLQYESEAEQERGKLRLKQTEIELKKAEQSLKSQIIINREEERMLRLRIEQEESQLRKLKNTLEKMTVYAPTDGLVVLKKIWKGDGWDKIEVGDNPWRGLPLIGLPDLSRMQVETYVNEVDVAKVQPGQKVEITLEAFPDRKFSGTITAVASISRNKSRRSNVKVFDILATINESDPVLKPGISAHVKIIVEKIPNVVYVPLNAIFNHEGKPVVYIVYDGSTRRCNVKLGKRNGESIVILDGLNGGERITLYNPYNNPD